MEKIFKKEEIGLAYYLPLFSATSFFLSCWPFFLNLYEKSNSFLFNAFFSIIAFAIVHLFSLLLLSYKKATKLFTAVLFVGNSLALYFMMVYKIQLDDEMLTNLFETNFAEALEFINFKLFFYILLLGILPSLIFIKKFKISYDKSQYIMILKQFLAIVFLTVLIFGSAVITPKFYYRVAGSRKLAKYLPPANYIISIIGVLEDKIEDLNREDLRTISGDAVYSHTDKNDKKNLIIFVLGESARADNFSINGYERETGKPLENQEIFSFKNVYSCGTSTFYSVPCMFSFMDRKDFNVGKAKNYENILDIFKKVGFDVYWKSNNGSCKNVCDRVDFSMLDTEGNNSYDSHFLDYLEEKLNLLKEKNNFIVLHTRGSHGPSYRDRYSGEFELFSPVCKSKDLASCSHEELVNAYDNSILYTNFILNEIIELLKKNGDRFNSALLYISDHGESLGENGQYMHGTAYYLANKYQKHVPFFLWFSDDFVKNFDINKSCLNSKTELQLSHDNLFHSLLGLFDIESSYYKKDLDLFNDCKTDN